MDTDAPPGLRLWTGATVQESRYHLFVALVGLGIQRHQVGFNQLV